MKKIVFLGSAIAAILTPIQALAQQITVNPPRGANNQAIGFGTVGDFVSNALVLAFAIAVLIVLTMLILGAYEWITSGGDKEAVAKARNRIINALIGLAVLAVAYAVANVFAQFTGINIKSLLVPTPNPNASGL